MRPGSLFRCRRALSLLFLLALAGCGATPSRPSVPGVERPGYTWYQSGDAVAPTPGPRAQGLMLMGGGDDWPLEAFRWFVERAGHGHIVILRASLHDELQRRLVDEVGGVASVQTFVFHGREGSDDPFVLAALRAADGIFIAGGDQARYIRFWKGSGVNRLLEQHVAAGKPLGGTSAGLAILGQSSYGALDGGSIGSREALADPLGDAVTIDTDFLHLPHLQRVITDSHFSERGRLGRLIAFLARAAHEQQRADLVGIGIDEDAALCIEEDGEARVFNSRGGQAWLVEPTHPARQLRAGEPLTHEDIRVTTLDADSRIDFASWRVRDAASVRVVHVRAGALDGGD